MTRCRRAGEMKNRRVGSVTPSRRGGSTGWADLATCSSALISHRSKTGITTASPTMALTNTSDECVRDYPLLIMALAMYKVAQMLRLLHPATGRRNAL